MSSSVSCAMFTFNQGAIDMFGMTFHSIGNELVCIVGDRITDRLFNINNAQGIINNQVVAEVICDFIIANTPGFQVLNNNNEKLAVMVIDPDSNLGVDLSTVSNEFLKRNIVWVLVGLTTPDFNTWDSYHRMTRRTGGIYVFINGASQILAQAVRSVIIEENTLKQAFRLNDSIITNDDEDENEQDQTTDGVGDMSFDHGLY